MDRLQQEIWVIVDSRPSPFVKTAGQAPGLGTSLCGKGRTSGSRGGRGTTARACALLPGLPPEPDCRHGSLETRSLPVWRTAASLDPEAGRPSRFSKSRAGSSSLSSDLSSGSSNLSRAASNLFRPSSNLSSDPKGLSSLSANLFCRSSDLSRASLNLSRLSSTSTSGSLDLLRVSKGLSRLSLELLQVSKGVLRLSSNLSRLSLDLFRLSKGSTRGSKGLTSRSLSLAKDKKRGRAGWRAPFDDTDYSGTGTVGFVLRGRPRKGWRLNSASFSLRLP